MPENSWTPAAMATIALAAATILLAITTGLHAVFQFINSRSSHPTSSPNKKTPSHKSTRLVFNALEWVVWPALILNIYVLIQEFRSDAPITRASVLTTSFIVAGFFFILVSLSLNAIWRSIRELASIDRDMLDVVKDVHGLTYALIDVVFANTPDAKKPAPDRTPPGMLEKLQSAISRLLG